MSGNTPITSALKTILGRARRQAAMRQTSQKDHEMPRNATVSAEISPAQALAIKALLTGKSIVDSAAAAGVDRTTLHRWLRDDPVFIAEYQTDRAEMLGGIRRALAALGQEAVTSLHESLTVETPSEIRLRATLALLKMLGADCPDECVATSAREASIAIRQRQGDTKMKELIASLTE